MHYVNGITARKDGSKVTDTLVRFVNGGRRLQKPDLKLELTI